MRNARTYLLTVGVALIWTGIAKAEEKSTPTISDLLPVTLRWTAKEGCSASASDRIFSLPAQTTALHDYFASFATQKHAISLHGDVRYECVYQVLAAAKKSGIPRLGFISEPPPASPR